MSGTLLLVDDDSDFVRIAQALLTGEGFHVLTATSIPEALQIAQSPEHSIDVILSDVILNGANTRRTPSDARFAQMTGYDLVLRLRQIPRYAETPIAMLTGRRTREDVERALQVGARDYILKPINPDTFIQKVKELAQRATRLRQTEKFFEVPMRSPARLQLWTVITSLGIGGGTVEIDSSLSRGERLELESESLSEIGIKKLFAEVVDCRHDEKRDVYSARFKILNLKGRDELILRRFVARSSGQERGEQ